jgi:resuscitation-promoting factor RpfB
MNASRKILVVSAVISLLLGVILVGCSTDANATEQSHTATIIVDGASIESEFNTGDSVQIVLDKAGVTLGNQDQVDPPSFTILTRDTSINIVRVTEEFITIEETIPFSNQTVKNETLPEGQTLLIQKGQNGTLAVTTRVVYEDNIETLRSEYTRTITEAAKPEIIMVGVQTPFSPIPIEGKIAYITTGNAWLMETNTGNRRPVVTTGDLDGHILEISPDGQWLLFSKSVEEEDTDNINALFVVELSNQTAEPFAINAKNVIHFADWIPDKTRTITYSTVEPRGTTDWLANNDLYQVTFSEAGAVLTNEPILGTSKEGVNFWWGTDFAWSEDGSRMAYAKPDSIGLVNVNDGAVQPLYTYTPYEPNLDWRWLAPLAWSPDYNALFTVRHNPVSTESYQQFNLSVLLPDDNLLIDLVEDAGMFAFPAPSPMNQSGRFTVAYLQALFPDRSDTSRYRLMIMDRDGSNRKELFPPEGSLGLSPQTVQWEPPNLTQNSGKIALIYQGNIYLYDLEADRAIQVTGDGSISRLDWQ